MSKSLYQERTTFRNATNLNNLKLLTEKCFVSNNAYIAIHLSGLGAIKFVLCIKIFKKNYFNQIFIYLNLKKKDCFY